MKETLIHNFRPAILVLWAIMAAIMTGCTKDPIILPNPDEEQPSGKPLVIVIYGPNSLGDRSYCDMIYTGVEKAAQQHGLRTLQFSPESEEEGLAYLETREWWEIASIEDNVMSWTALRKKDDGTTYTASFSMTKVND